jgi:alkaline phosphatase
MSFQDLPGYALVTTSTTVIGEPNDGNHYAPAFSLLDGGLGDHKRGMAPLRTDEEGCALEFDPRDFELEGGNMVLWNDELGGEYPWDKCYYTDDMEGCDITFIMQHATDSASTAGTLATGHKSAISMLSLSLYEEKVSTLVEDAMYCGKAGGVISSVPIFHATPAAFMIHANARSDRDALRRGYLEVKPTAVGSSHCCTYKFLCTLEN